MQELFRAYTDILLRRQGPDVLPGSSFLLRLAIAAYLGVSVIGLSMNGTLLQQPAMSLGAILFDAGLLCLWVWIMLGVAGQPARLRQTLSAALGCGAIIGFYTLPIIVVLLAWPPLPADGIAALEGEADPGFSLIARIAVAAYVVLLAWYAAVLGHILSRAMDIHSLGGLALGIFYVLASIAITDALFPLGA